MSIGLLDNGAPRTMWLNDLNSLRLVHILQSMLQVGARPKSTNQEDPLECRVSFVLIAEILCVEVVVKIPSSVGQRACFEPS